MMNISKEERNMKFKKQRLWATALAAILTISAGVLPAQAAEVNSSETTAAESAVTDEETVDMAIDEVDLSLIHI